jgi:hypothetical protein
MDKLIEELEAFLIHVALEMKESLGHEASRRKLIEILMYEIKLLIQTEEDEKEAQRLRLLASSITVDMLKKDIADRQAQRNGNMSPTEQDIVTNILQMIRYLS